MYKNEKLNNKQEISLIDLLNFVKRVFHLLYKKWILILFFSLTGLLIGYIYSTKKKPQFHAVLTYVMEEEKNGSNNLSSLGGMASQFGIGNSNTGNSGIFSSTYLLEFMKSRILFEKLLLSSVFVDNTEITMAEFYIQTNKLRKNSKDSEIDKTYFPINSEINKLTNSQVQILNQIRLDLISEDKLAFGSKDKKSILPQIIVTSEHEIFAKIFCEKLMQVTSEYYIESKTKKAKSNVDFLQKQVDSLRNEFKSTVYDFSKASDEIYNLNPALKAKGISPTIKQVNVQVNSTLLTSLISNLELAKNNLRIQTPLFQVIDTPIYPLEVEVPDKTKYATVGFFISFIMISVLTILIEFKNNNFHEL